MIWRIVIALVVAIVSIGTVACVAGMVLFYLETQRERKDKFINHKMYKRNEKCIKRN